MPEWKGKYSEKLVNNRLVELPDEYTIFHNLLFEADGHSTQIDHVVVSPFETSFNLGTTSFNDSAFKNTKSDLII